MQSQAEIHIPVHVHGNHWVHVTITLCPCANASSGFTAGFEFDDPLFGGEENVIKNLMQWLKDEFEDKDTKKRKVSTSDLSIMPSETPHQKNGYDCGVFMNQVSHYRARGLPLSFTQDDMPYFRRRMVLEILNCQLLEDILDSLPASAAEGLDDGDAFMMNGGGEDEALHEALRRSLEYLKMDGATGFTLD